MSAEQISEDFSEKSKVETSVGIVNQWEYKTQWDTISIAQFMYFFLTLLLGFAICAVKGYFVLVFDVLVP